MMRLHALPTHTPMRPMQLSGEPVRGANSGGRMLFAISGASGRRYRSVFSLR
jgi:hypothetical protein